MISNDLIASNEFLFFEEDPLSDKILEKVKRLVISCCERIFCKIAEGTINKWIRKSSKHITLMKPMVRKSIREQISERTQLKPKKFKYLHIHDEDYIR